MNEKLCPRDILFERVTWCGLRAQRVLLDALNYLEDRDGYQKRFPQGRGAVEKCVFQMTLSGTAS